MLNDKLKTDLEKLIKKKPQVTVLTGAGISAESGIPTFRGPEGYWTVGSKEYHPQEMATFRMFRQNTDEVWHWYLYRRGICRQADPNTGHLALVMLEERLDERFLLITQNVDGLHIRAGNSLDRSYQIHGNIDYMRCVDACTADMYPISDSVPPKSKTESLTEADRQALRCPKCGGMTRPHVLWFDESYDERFYRYQSSLSVAARTDLLIVVGTSGATNLPNQVVRTVINQGGLVIDVNIELNVFSQLAMQNGGYFLQQPSGEVLPELVKILTY